MEGKSWDHPPLSSGNIQIKSTGSSQSVTFGAIHPGYFDGTTYLSEYETHFRACVELNGWNEHKVVFKVFSFWWLCMKSFTSSS